MNASDVIVVLVLFLFFGGIMVYNWRAFLEFNKAMKDAQYVSYSCDKCGYTLESSEYDQTVYEEIVEHEKNCDPVVIMPENNKQTKRKTIPQNVKDKVWNRDNGKCIQCGSSENLEFDHIIPISKGGANTYRNIQLLCEDCNRSKSDNIG